jgi:hypothetical protein
MQRFESLLLAPAIILGTPAEAGLNQKNSTSLTLGTQTAFDFCPSSAGVFIPKCSMALAKTFQTASRLFKVIPGKDTRSYLKNADYVQGQGAGRFAVA